MKDTTEKKITLEMLTKIVNEVESKGLTLPHEIATYTALLLGFSITETTENTH